MSGQPFNQFPEALQQHSRRFDASLAIALENSARVLAGEQRQNQTELVDNQRLLKQSYIEHLDIEYLPADLVMEWQMRFMLDQQIVELIKKIEKTALKA